MVSRNGGNAALRWLISCFGLATLLTIVAQAGTPPAPAGTMTTSVADGKLVQPSSVTVDEAGNLYIADTGNYVIRKIDLTGKMTIIAGVEGRKEKYEQPEGGGPKPSAAGPNRPAAAAGMCTSTTGDHCKATEAVFTSPRSIAIDAKGNMYISDSRASKIRRVDGATGIVTVYAGDGGGGWSPRQLHGQEGVQLDSQGNLYVADRFNNTVRKIGPATDPGKRQSLITIAGLGPYEAGCTDDHAVVKASSVALREPQDVAIDKKGNIYIADTGCRRIRQIGTDGMMRTLVGGGSTEIPTAKFPGKEIFKPLEVNLKNPVGVEVDAEGNLYISDAGRNVIWLYEAATAKVRVLAGLLGPESEINTICKSHTNAFGDGCPGNEARLNAPYRVAIAANGDVYIPEQGGLQWPTPPFAIRVLHAAQPAQPAGH